jgi:hypothetical protein
VAGGGVWGSRRQITVGECLWLPSSNYMVPGDGNQVFNYKWLIINYKLQIFNYKSMITILKDKGEMETRGSPLPGYVKLKLQIYY